MSFSYKAAVHPYLELQVYFLFFYVTNLGIIFETTVANKMSDDDRIVKKAD